MAVAASSAGTAGPVGRTRRGSVLFTVRSIPVNIPAAVLVVGGAVVQAVALVGVSWIESPSGRLGFTGMQEWARPGYAQMFFGWIAWLLLAVSAIVGVAACVRWHPAAAFRYIGAVVGVAGAFATVCAVLLLAYQTHDPSFHVARNYSAGAYLAVLGLLATALGAAAGTGRRG